MLLFILHTWVLITPNAILFYNKIIFLFTITICVYYYYFKLKLLRFFPSILIPFISLKKVLSSLVFVTLTHVCMCVHVVPELVFVTLTHVYAHVQVLHVLVLYM